MASPLEVTLLLCDSAVAEPSGKVHMLGAGWSITGSPTSPQAVVAMIQVPWDRANQPMTVVLALLDSDGGQVSVTGAADGEPVRSELRLEVGRPPGVLPGSPLDAAVVVAVPALPLSPGRYEWRLAVAEKQVTRAFQVRGPVAPGAALA